MAVLDDNTELPYDLVLLSGLRSGVPVTSEFRIGATAPNESRYPKP